MLMTEYSESLLQYNYKTLPITISVKSQKFRTEDILTYLEPDRFNKYCKEGCPNYEKRWSCPPYCPDFITYAKNFSHIELYLFYTETKQYQIENNTSPLSAYNFVGEKLQEWLNEKENHLGGVMITSNSCEICNICALTNQNRCHNPRQMRYNLTAFGFNIDRITKEVFSHTLQWSNNKQRAKHASSVGAILLTES